MTLKMGSCRDCRHWRRIDYAPDPATEVVSWYDRQVAGKCRRASSGEDGEPSDPAALAFGDAEHLGEAASLVTTALFGCVMFERKP